MTDKATEKTSGARIVSGRVTSAKRDKTITVLVERREKHPLYGKFIRRSTKLHAHDEDNRCREGDLVRIQECPPVSAQKHWRLLDVVESSASA